VFEPGTAIAGRPRVLFTSPWGPYPKRDVEDDPVDYFYYRNTLKQGLFQLRIFQSWHCLHFLAQNLPVASTVLENPAPDEVKRELASGEYQVVALSFNQMMLNKVLELARWLKKTHPHIDLVVGGYGTAVFSEQHPLVDELEGLCDQICTGEGLEFFRGYLEERWEVSSPPGPLTQELLPSINSLFRTRLPLFRQMMFVGGLGCIHGCSFCATSHHFDRKHIPLFQGEELFKSILEQARKFPDIQSAVIYDEDFLAKRENVEALTAGMARYPELRERPLLLTVFASMSSLRRYSIEELVACGIGTVYVGVETFQDDILEEEGLGKRKGNVEELFSELHDHGINTLGSLIIGWDGQTPESAREDARRFVSLNPTFYQVVPLHPAPGTPLWERLMNEGRMRDDYEIENDSIGDFTFVLRNMEREEAEGVVSWTYTGLVEEGGPWPFRLAANLLRGYRNLRDSDNPLLRERALAYEKLLKPILPVALLCRAMFHGEAFRHHHREFRRDVRELSPARYLLAWVTGLALWPFLQLLSGWGRLKYRLNPLGDQPNKIRRTYPGRPS
jgi:radical SAM superfamily enzyme YgiQ (UPF0313 family)